ncbi:MAG: hypothetical protein MJA29_01725 [Candidatus Omnitrophica bacterium]|nr:hypothetical protein [Candidatus Omnitrophota bacterium]
MNRFLGLMLSVAVLITVSGCAAGRSTLNIEVPTNTRVPGVDKQVFIRSIADMRDFQDKPASPEIPSLGGGIARADEQTRLRAIGRKRNAYGRAMGDILLPEDKDVSSQVYAMLRNALFSLGYDVTDSSVDAREDAVSMDVIIDKYWGWFTPGFWVVSVSAEMATALTVNLPEREEVAFTIEAADVNRCSAATSANWKKTFNRATTQYIAEAKKKLAEILE